MVKINNKIKIADFNKKDPYAEIKEIGIGKKGTVYLSETPENIKPQRQIAKKIAIAESIGTLVNAEYELMKKLNYEELRQLREAGVITADERLPMGTKILDKAPGTSYKHMNEQIKAFIFGMPLVENFIDSFWGIKFSKEQITSISLQLAKQLKVMQEIGISYNRLRPGNIIHIPNGDDIKVHISDLGNAIKLDKPNDKVHNPGISYIDCPEGYISKATDIYGFGTLLIDYLCNRSDIDKSTREAWNNLAKKAHYALRGKYTKLLTDSRKTNEKYKKAPLIQFKPWETTWKLLKANKGFMWMKDLIANRRRAEALHIAAQKISQDVSDPVLKSLWGLAAKCVAPDPDERLQSFDEIINNLSK